MSFLVKGDIGPTNIAEGGVPRDMGITNFDSGLFQAIARAGLEAAGEGSLGMGGLSPTGGRKRKSRMAGENFARIRVGSKKRGGAEAVNYSPRTREKDERERVRKEEAEERVGSKVRKPRGSEGNFGRGDFQFGGRRTRARGVVGSKPTPMTKEEYDKMPKKAKRKFELAPGMEDLIDRFPTREERRRGSKTSRSKTREEMRDPNATATVYNRGDGSKRLSRDERRDPNAGATIRSTR